MKTRFTTIDIRASIAELQRRYLGMRVANCYDIDNKTYLIKLQKKDMKVTILLESGSRIHSTQFDWPKHTAPSGFSMKLRKHLRTRRLESVTQLGGDRIIDLTFGSSEAAYHVILELYDRGNIVLTDFEYTILNILRPRTDQSDTSVRFAVREKYPVESAKQPDVVTTEKIQEILAQAKSDENLKKFLVPKLDFGPAVIEHVLLGAGISSSARIGHEFIIDRDARLLDAALAEAARLTDDVTQPGLAGYIVQKREKKPVTQPGEDDVLLTYNEFHPALFRQHEALPYVKMESFDAAVDEFFSRLEGQKLDLKVLQQERSALKKLDNVKRDHKKRIEQLQQEQDVDSLRAQLIEMNLPLVDSALRVIQSALANQISWPEIADLVSEATKQHDPVAGCIKGLQLEQNHITLLLKDPFEDEEGMSEDEDAQTIPPMKVSVDLSLTAYANARRYFDMKRTAAKKEQRTVEASSKALKSAEQKTREQLKEVAVAAHINRTRKTYWFEKFLWFVSSENYIVVGGRDGQQNELLVKRYLTPGDLYVHADLHGATSVVIKNAGDGEVPPKTLNEAGTMAVCHSAAWDAKVVTSAWWVRHDQVSKTAPTGEYLSTGSFMIRGKKNFLPPCYLIYGFGFIYKIDEDSIARHQGERKIRTTEEDDDASVVGHDEATSEVIDELADRSEEDDASSQKGDCECTDENEAPSEVAHAGNYLSHRIASDEGMSQDGEAKTEPEDGDTNVEDTEALFPDTTVELKHVRGDTFALQTRISHGEESDVSQEQPVAERGGAKFSAKQRRELKKKKKHLQSGEVVENIEEEEASHEDGLGKENVVASFENDRGETSAEVALHTQQQQQQLKRGQKAKLKKMKEKYGEQDEEERQLRMQILASSGEPKEKKKDKKKDKKKNTQSVRTAHPSEGPRGDQGQKSASGGSRGLPQWKLEGKVTLDDIHVETPMMKEGEQAPVTAGEEEAPPDDEAEDEAALRPAEDGGLLDTLTGVPVAEDTLLYGIPVCAPYSALLAYKHRVKLTPGATKRGKAAKTALAMFMFDKASTQREKDLLKVVKDTDLSRCMPGKVKISAPHLHQHKKKKK